MPTFAPKLKNHSTKALMASKINTFRGIAFRITAFIIFTLFLGFSAAAYDGDDVLEIHDSTAAVHHAEDTGKVDLQKVAFEHILDSHYWHFWGKGHESVSLGLPCIIYSNTKGLQFFSSSVFHHGEEHYNGYYLEEEMIKSEDPDEKIYDFSITKNVMQLFIAAGILLLLFTSIARAYKNTGVTSAPKGKQSFFEPLITFVRDDIAQANIGEKSDRFTPYLLTVFFLILLNNALGMLPIGANLTGNIAFTFVLATFTLIITNINARSGYWKHIFLPQPLYLWPILMPLELLGVFSKPFALMIRLFANMSAGHIIVISLVGLIFFFKSIWISPVSVGFALFIDVLECLVALLQAYIFTMLTALFIGSAVAGHHHEEHAEEHAKH
jgi:F-type H+-transporting ATPase subunit a